CQAVPVSCTTSVQVAPPLLLTCTFSPAPSAPLVPDTVSEVSLVMKSPAVPVSSAMAVMSTAPVGGGAEEGGAGQRVWAAVVGAGGGGGAGAGGGGAEVWRGGPGLLPGARRGGPAVAAHLHLLAGAERAVGARHRQRGVAGDEVAGGAGVVGDRRDVHRRRRRIVVDVRIDREVSVAASANGQRPVAIFEKERVGSVGQGLCRGCGRELRK